MKIHCPARRLYRSSTAALLGTVGLLGLLESGQPLSAADVAAYAPAPAISPFPPLSWRLPFDVDEDEIRSLVNQDEVMAAHRLFGTLSWQAFIALNWPAGDNGQPDSTKNMSDNSSWRVWNYWRSSGSLFLPDGGKPAPWDWKLQKITKARNRANKVPGKTGPRDNFEAFTGPLVDQNGKWARFEIRVDKEEFDYIVKNELYNQDGQVAFSQRPKNNQVELPLNGDGKHGAIEIKLAWKELGANDDRSRFYCTDLEITPSEPKGSGPVTKTIPVALVGMHIAMRTKSSPEWIWSTFEQIDNVRQNKDAHGHLTHPNFFNPKSTAAPNILAPKNAVVGPDGLVPAPVADATTWIESQTTTPTQATRLDVPTQEGLNPLDKKLGEVTAKLNAEVQAKLAGQNSVFQYYELIDTQWPLHPNAPAVPGGEGSAPESVRYKTPGAMIPVFLINTTMETFFQTGPQKAGNMEQDDRLPDGNAIVDSTMINGTESCVGCHYSAGIAIGFKKDKTGKEVPYYGELGNFGKNGNAGLSWMLQQEPQRRAPRGGTTK